MARKDVNLVIRAKDEAEGVVKSITTAINGFTDAQKKLQSEGEGTQGSLNELGAAIGRLDKQLSGKKVGQAFATEMDKAAAAVDNLDRQLDETQSNLTQLNRQLGQAEQYTARYEKKLEGARAAQQRQSKAVEKAKTDQRELSDSYDKAVAAVSALEARQRSLPGELEKQSTKVQQVTQRYEKLSAQMRATNEPADTLQKNFASSQRNYEKQTGILRELQDEYARIGGQLRAAGSAAAIFSAQSAKAANDLARQEAVLGKIKTNITDLNGSVRTASAQQNSLSRSVDKTTSALASQQAQINRAEAGYVELAEAASRFDAASTQGSQLGKNNLEAQLVDQGQAVQRARKEFEEYRGTVASLWAEVGRVGVPTREMSQQLAFAAQRADEAQMKLLLQEEALERLGRSYREVSQDLSSVASGQAQFIAQQERLGAALTETANDGYRARKAIRDVHKASDSAAGSISRAAGATRSQAAASERAATATGRLANAYRQVYGDTRKSLSYTQRLRGEVLSLIAAYGGFYGVVQLLGRVVNAYQILEGAQARLNVAMAGDVDQSAQEMDFLRRTAGRLGVELGVLATQYSKFAIATKGTNLEGENTRKIFTAVAEAARVNRSSTDEMGGVFTALTQIVSKGAVQMEELRQQLGDRLPGAIQLMADGLNVTTAELIKMMEAGEVTADALVPFSEALDERFGPGLADALNSTTVALGRMQNAAFQALVSFGRGGFLDSFKELLNDITTTLQSADFEEFLGRLSQGFALIADTLGVVVTNFDLFAAAVAGFLGLKLVPLAFAAANAIYGMAAAAARGAGGLVGLATATRTAGAAAAGAAVNVSRFTLAVRALTSSTGVGLAITAVSAAIGLWATRATEATEAMNTHQKIVDEVRNAYDLVGNSVEDWKEQLETLTDTEAIANLDRVQKAAQQARDQFRQVLNDRGGTFNTRLFGYEFVQAGQKFQDELQAVFDKFEDGEIKAEDLVDAVNEITKEYRSGSDANARLADASIAAARAIEETAEAVGEAENIVKTYSDDADVASEALEELGNQAKETSRSFDELAAEKAAAFNAAMNGMSENVAGLKEQLDYLEQSKALEKLLEQALSSARGIDEIIAAMDRFEVARDDLRRSYLDSAVSGSLVDRIIGVESGGNPSAKNPNSSATGLGQFIESTWLRLFKENFPDRAAGMTNAAILALRENANVSRQMVELYLRENAAHLEKAGQAVTDANLYLAHFLGPQGATNLLSAPTGTRTEDVLGAGQISSNRSILEGKTREQVIDWARQKVGVSQQELAASEAVIEAEQDRQEQERKAAEKAQEEREKEQAATDERLSDAQFEIEQQRLKNAEKEREAAIEAAIRDARQDDPNITAEEIAQLRERVGQQYDLANAVDAEEEATKRAEAAQEKVNQLLQQRNALEEQYEAAKEDGDTAKEDELRDKMVGINAEMLKAIENAKAMWGAVGGQTAATAIERLNAAEVSANRFGMKAQENIFSWKKVGELFQSGLTSAFRQFTSEVDEFSDVGAKAREAFMQFASDFLRKIAEMIFQQAILNALQGTSFGSFLGIGGGGGGFALGHTGGVVGSKRVGSGNGVRRVSPAVFANAARFHDGGVPGLRPNEVPIIAKKNEEILSEDDPRNILNGGGESGAGVVADKRPKIVNAFDGTSFLEEAMKDKRGQELILNFVRANRTTVRGMLGV